MDTDTTTTTEAPEMGPIEAAEMARIDANLDAKMAQRFTAERAGYGADGWETF